MHRHHLTGNHWELNTLSCSDSAHVWISGVAIPSPEGSACAFASSHQAHTEIPLPHLWGISLSGDEAHGQCSALGWIPFMWTSGKQMQWLPSASTHETLRQQHEQLCFQQKLHLVLQNLHQGCPKRPLTYSKGPQNTPISPAPIAHLTVQTKKFRSPESDYHILVQQWRLSRTLYLN